MRQLTGTWRPALRRRRAGRRPSAQGRPRSGLPGSPWPGSVGTSVGSAFKPPLVTVRSWMQVDEDQRPPQIRNPQLCDGPNATVAAGPIDRGALALSTFDGASVFDPEAAPPTSRPDHHGAEGAAARVTPPIGTCAALLVDAAIGGQQRTVAHARSSSRSC